MGKVLWRHRAGYLSENGLKIWVCGYKTKQSKAKLMLKFYITISSESGRSVLLWSLVYTYCLLLFYSNEEKCSNKKSVKKKKKETKPCKFIEFVSFPQRNQKCRRVLGLRQLTCALPSLSSPLALPWWNFPLQKCREGSTPCRDEGLCSWLGSTSTPKQWLPDTIHLVRCPSAMPRRLWELLPPCPRKGAQGAKENCACLLTYPPTLLQCRQFHFLPL